jgi:hypothetical protein
MHTKSTENSIRLGQWSRRLLGLCRRLWRLLRATEHLSWSARQWKKDLNIWLQRSSPETYARLMEDNLLDRHLQRLLERAGRRYRELRQQGVSWKKARRLLELELAKEIGTVSLTTPAAPVTLPSVPSIPKDSAAWLEMLEQAVRLAAPEGYAEARRRGILQAHLENVLHWVHDQQHIWSDMEKANPDRRRTLFEEARQRAVQIDWQTPPLRHDPTCWEQDLEQYLRSGFTGTGHNPGIPRRIVQAGSTHYRTTPSGLAKLRSRGNATGGLASLRPGSGIVGTAFLARPGYRKSLPLADRGHRRQL